MTELRQFLGLANFQRKFIDTFSVVVTYKSIGRLLATHIIIYLTDNDILSVHQFDFRAAHSTVDQVLATSNDITLMID